MPIEDQVTKPNRIATFTGILSQEAFVMCMLTVCLLTNDSSVFQKKLFEMTSQFLDSYTSNLQVLSIELNRNQELIQLLNNNIKTLTEVVQEKLKQLFSEFITKQKMDVEPVEQNSQIKLIYLHMKQIQKSEAEKRSLTRKSCDILDNYLVSLDEKVKDLASNHCNGDDRDEIFIHFANKTQIKKPVEGKAVIVDLIKKMENGKTKTDNETNVTVLDDENKDIEILTQKFEGFTTFEDITLQSGKSKSSVSDLIHRMDNFGVFSEKIIDIFLEMKSRYKIEEPVKLETSVIIEENGTPTYSEHCPCRKGDVGEMVACDNKECKTKWYHFECVALYKNPEGLWYCPSCLIFENVTI